VRIRRFVAAGILLAAVCATRASAEVRLPVPPAAGEIAKRGIRFDSPAHITADSLSYDEETGVAVAEGNVELTLGNRSMRADRIRYDSQTGEADLSGKVRYKDADEDFSFDRITINLDNETGVLYNGTIRISGSNYLIASSKIEKTGKKSFAIEKGTLTTCPCDPEPDWKFEVRRSRVTLDEYAFGKDITFRIRGVPVLWLPWGAFPVKLTRQSGLLLPNFSSNRTRGYTLQVPGYWAINRWSDATVTLDAMSRRGYRPEVEYRFVPNPDSEGAIRASYFHDRAAGKDRARYYGENVFHSGGFTANAKVELPSDPRYYLDLVDTDDLRSMRHARSEGFVAVSGDRTGHSVSAVWNKDLQETPVPDNTAQRVPEYTMTLLPSGFPVLRIDAGGTVSATRFQRRDGGDEIRGRGYGEIARAFPLYRSVTLVPFFFADFLESRFETAPGTASSGGRVVPGGGATLTAGVRRDFPSAGGRYVHVADAEAGYRFVPQVRQDDLPVTDRWSRLAPQSRVVLGITQRILEWREGSFPKERAAFHLQWAYDLKDREAPETPYVDPLAPYVRTLRDQIDIGAGRPPGRGDSASDIYAGLSVSPNDRWKLQGEALFDPAESAFVVGAIGTEWKKDKEHRVLAEYRISRGLAEDAHALVAWRLLRRLGIHAEANYSVKNGNLTNGSAGVTVYPASDCWNVGISVERKTQPDDTNVKLSFELRGIGSVGK
jgi:LPS-assembly protein